MQKVSKQSLAMIALSILLAISIALTFTFAALTATKTAKGTIAFSGNVTVKYDGDATASEGVIKIADPTYNGATSSFDMTENTNKFTVTADKDVYIKITVTVNTATIDVTLPSSLTVGTGTLGGDRTSITKGGSAVFKNTTAITGATSGLDIEVKKIISAISFDATDDMIDGNITIKVDAQTNAAFA